MTAKRNILRRYTDLGSLLDILKRRAITLLPPSTWDDRNDRLMMETYRKVKGLETLLALCMSKKAETYHHWKVFTDKNNGVCIHFDKVLLIAAMKASGVVVRPVSYLKFADLQPAKLPPSRLPYLKRLAFQDEGEVRAVYENSHKENGLKKVPISLKIIDRVTLNPWMPKPVAESVEAVILELSKDATFDVFPSTLIESSLWRKFAGKYAGLDLA